MHCTLLAAYLYLAISFENFARKNFTYSFETLSHTLSRLCSSSSTNLSQTPHLSHLLRENCVVALCKREIRGRISLCEHLFLVDCSASHPQCPTLIWVQVGTALRDWQVLISTCLMTTRERGSHFFFEVAIRCALMSTRRA
jgi:hypothetical protein